MELPAIIQGLIFEHVLFAGGRQSVLCLIRVCKSWQASALPLLYREVEVQNASALEDHAIRLMQIEMTGADPGSWIRNLVIAVPPDAATWHAGVTSAFMLLLPHLTNLRELVAWPSPMPPQALEALFRQAQFTLIRLVFAVSGDRTLGPRLHRLNTFTTLRHLKLRMCRGSEHVLETATIQGLNIPSLVDLHWIVDGPKNERGLAFLSQSRFASLQELTLELELWMDKQPILPLHPFFAAHTNLKTVTVYASDDVIEQIFLCGLRASHIVFYDVPPTSVITMSGSRLRRLTIVLNVHADNWTTRRLRGLVQSVVRTKEALIEDIWLKARPRQPRLQWSRLSALALQDENVSNQVGLLMAASAQLEKRGVQLLDEDGKRAVTMWE